MGSRPRRQGGRRYTAESFGSHDLNRVAAQPSDVRRPEAGQQASTLLCPNCHLPLSSARSGVRAARARRWVWLALGVLGSVAAVRLGVSVFVIGGQVVEEGASNPLDVVLPSFLVAVVAAITGWVRWVSANDVRGPGRRVSRLSRRSLRCPNH